MSYKVNSCEWCNKTFYASRSSAKYCSNSCKQRAYEHRKHIREEARKITITNLELVLWDATTDVDPSFNQLLDELFASGEIVYLKNLFGLMMYPDINAVMWKHGLFEKLEEIGRLAQIPF